MKLLTNDFDQRRNGNKFLYEPPRHKNKLYPITAQLIFVHDSMCTYDQINFNVEKTQFPKPCAIPMACEEIVKLELNMKRLVNFDMSFNLMD